MNKIPYFLLTAGLLCLGLACTAARPRKRTLGEQSSQPLPSSQPAEAKTLAIVVKTDPNLMLTNPVHTDTIKVLHREPLTDQQKRALALRVEDKLAWPFENSSVFKRVEKQTALQGPSMPHGMDYVLIVTIETIRSGTIQSYRSSPDRRHFGPSGVVLHARLLDETGSKIWQLSQRDRPRTLGSRTSDLSRIAD